MNCSHLLASVRRFRRDQSGATAIEYAIVAGGVAVAIAASVATLSPSVQALYQRVLDAMPN